MRKKELEESTKQRKSIGKSPFRSPLQAVSPSNGTVSRKSISTVIATPHKSPFETPKSGPKLKSTPAPQKQDEVTRTLFKTPRKATKSL